MKRIILLLSIIGVCASCFAENFTYTYKGSTLSYKTRSDTEVAVVGYVGTISDVEIPTRVNTNTSFYKVTEIASAFFKSSLTSIKIPKFSHFY